MQSEGSVSELAQGFRSALSQTIQLAIGHRTKVAVALSGGIDSAAITALAVEAVGPDNVVAFTHVFDDASHSDETLFAKAVCQRLKINNHIIYKISLSDFLTAIPETVWRAENFSHWPKSFLLPASRYIRDAGFDQYLTGFGIAGIIWPTSTI